MKRTGDRKRDTTKRKDSEDGKCTNNAPEQRLTINGNHTGGRKKTRRQQKDSDDDDSEDGKCTDNVPEQRLTINGTHLSVTYFRITREPRFYICPSHSGQRTSADGCVHDVLIKPAEIQIC